MLQQLISSDQKEQMILHITQAMTAIRAEIVEGKNDDDKKNEIMQNLITAIKSDCYTIDHLLGNSDSKTRNQAKQFISDIYRESTQEHYAIASTEIKSQSQQIAQKWRKSIKNNQDQANEAKKTAKTNFNDLTSKPEDMLGLVMLAPHMPAVVIISILSVILPQAIGIAREVRAGVLQSRSPEELKTQHLQALKDTLKYSTNFFDSWLQSTESEKIASQEPAKKILDSQLEARKQVLATMDDLIKEGYETSPSLQYVANAEEIKQIALNLAEELDRPDVIDRIASIHISAPVETPTAEIPQEEEQDEQSQGFAR